MLINDLSARIRAHEPALHAAAERVLRSGWVVLGPEVKRFEEQFATYLGVRNCVSVANGTDAIEFALRAFALRAGERVATVANAGMYGTIAAAAVGLEPVFMDVALDTRNVTVAEVERAIQVGARAVIVTHLYGNPVAEIREIAQLCRRTSVPLLEDCAQAHGASVDGRAVGSFGDAASFSFYPTKNLGALGDGGAVTTDDADLAKRLRALRQYGWSEKYRVEMAGARNSRLDELQAAFLNEFLPGLDALNARRRAIAQRYGSLLRHPSVELPNWQAGSVAHLYVVRTTCRAALRTHLSAAGIGCDVHYPIPDHRQPVFGETYAHVRLPNTEKLAGEVLTLPCYPEMTDADVARVANAINAWDAQDAGH
ncbi:MAG TPA: DegT/DnrJ/EryC1/StrS family aminotransferase [Ramlibacter sp.]|jgi:dTDP-4-amino-4,6-dideoxygalactose transaminase|uniref:DegT/DnrJ/EryC1/StrS family aminotransferase n=1 Tax=Ramlibacter sp. TaxID=1917967 RepID=UPI002D6CC449|nr:DegT/DnrJ/EryC1/StrS family aminotransferase [Ramlibacter sp.]HZY20069.1 DegT/DnrJ/EryC1/StrS family aminotransferase [Ramlibacter sp.]